MSTSRACKRMANGRTAALEQRRIPDINIKVAGEDGRDWFYVVKKRTNLGKLMDMYCERYNINKTTVQFRFNNKRIKPTDVPMDVRIHTRISIAHTFCLQIDLCDGDLIDVVAEDAVII